MSTVDAHEISVYVVDYSKLLFHRVTGSSIRCALVDPASPSPLTQAVGDVQRHSN